jgi:hypothetical protein
MNEQALYIQSDIPPGMTCEQYRRRHAMSRRSDRRHSRGRLFRLFGRP